MSHSHSSSALGSAVSESVLTILSGSSNRFIEMATIRFRMPAPAQAVLRVYNQQGQAVCQKDGHFESGDNHFTLQRDDFPESGLYMYSIESAFGNAIRKIMLY